MICLSLNSRKVSSNASATEISILSNALAHRKDHQSVMREPTAYVICQPMFITELLRLQFPCILCVGFSLQRGICEPLFSPQSLEIALYMPSQSGFQPVSPVRLITVGRKASTKHRCGIEEYDGICFDQSSDVKHVDYYGGAARQDCWDQIRLQ
jgi:hypothetical protein